MEFDRESMEVLRPAADRLRRALQRMEADDVPAALRPLAESSARRLPPPLLKRALTELDSSEWLRAEVEADGELEPDSPEQLYVSRPDGWEAGLRMMVEEATCNRQQADRAQLERELASALERVSRLEEELEAGSREVAAAERRARDRLRAEVETAQVGRRRAEAQARSEAHDASRFASRVERLEAELTSTERRLDTLRALLEKERRAGAVSEPASSSRGWFPDDPVEMAEELDRIHSAVRLVPSGPGEEPLPERPDVRLPAGFRPDREESVRWLARHSLRWLIDGYNVAFQVSSDPDPSTRSRVISAAGRIATIAPPGSMVVVVFDSSVDTASLPAERRVRVVYAPSADEWIIDHAGPGTVVVTSDRRVREAAEQRGATGVWAEALAEWMAGGGTIGP